MIRTWVADVTPLHNEETYRKYYKNVPEHRRVKADKIAHQEDRALSIGAWTLYEKAKQECGASEQAVFNLSHSGNYVLCSIEESGNTEIKVGCDIEEIKKLHSKLIHRYFFESEEAYILGKETEEERAEAFYQYWVLKESFMKATRYGMGLGLNSFEIACAKGEEPRLLRQPAHIKEKYYFKEYELGIPYRIAVCSTSNQFAEKIQEVYFTI